jgi:hypothetical protein
MDPPHKAACIGAWVAGSRPGQGGDRGRRSCATRFRRNCRAALSPTAYGFTRLAGHSSPCAGVTRVSTRGASMDPPHKAACIGAWVAGSRPGQGGDRGRRSCATRFRRNCRAALLPTACGVHEARGPFITLRGRDRVSTRGRQHGPTQCSGLHRRVGGRVEARPRWGQGASVLCDSFQTELSGCTIPGRLRGSRNSQAIHHLARA